MSKRASPTLVGTFVIVAVALAVGVIVVLGGGRFFRDTTRVIVYFDSSVAGLRVGAPVKFRGIDIGSVHDIRINVSGAVRDPERVRIPVILELDQDRLTSEGVVLDLHDRALLRTLVDRGLRAELATESLVTGLRYVAIDVKPGTEARLEGDPNVGYPEIPSVRGTLEQVPDKIQKVLASLADADLAGTVRSIRATADDAHALLGSRHLTRTVEGLDALTQNLNRTVAELDRTTRAIPPVAEEWQAAARSARQMVAPEGALASQLTATLKELQTTARSLRRLADHIDRDPGAVVRGGRP